MGRFDNIKTAIDTNIKTNGNQAITGAVLNSVMKQTVDSVDTELTELESKTAIEGIVVTDGSSSSAQTAINVDWEAGKSYRFIVYTKEECAGTLIVGGTIASGIEASAFSAEKVKLGVLGTFVPTTSVKGGRVYVDSSRFSIGVKVYVLLMSEDAYVNITQDILTKNINMKWYVGGNNSTPKFLSKYAVQFKPLVSMRSFNGGSTDWVDLYDLTKGADWTGSLISLNDDDRTITFNSENYNTDNSGIFFYQSLLTGKYGVSVSRYDLPIHCVCILYIATTINGFYFMGGAAAQWTAWYEEWLNNRIEKSIPALINKRKWYFGTEYDLVFLGRHSFVFKPTASLRAFNGEHDNVIHDLYDKFKNLDTRDSDWVIECFDDERMIKISVPSGKEDSQTGIFVSYNPQTDSFSVRCVGYNVPQSEELVLNICSDLSGLYFMGGAAAQWGARYEEFRSALLNLDISGGKFLSKNTAGLAYTGIGYFDVKEGRIYRITIRAEAPLVESNSTLLLGLGGNDNINIASEDLTNGFTWVKKATTSFKYGRVYVDQYNGNEGIPVELSITDITDELPKGLEEKVIAVSAKSKKPNWGGDNVKPLTLLHFSDVHSDARRYQFISMLRSLYADYITDVIHTGDSVRGTSKDDFTFWDDSKILNVIGNHDTATDMNTIEGWYALSASDCFAKYFEPFVNAWGVTYSEGCCYYFKDYATQNIRMIVIDGMHYDDAQNTWLQNTLSAALNKSMHVIIASHFIPSETEKNTESLFDTLYDSNPWETDWTGFGLLDARVPILVQDFMNNGGDFICYLSGHVHDNIFRPLTEYPTQYVIGADTAACKGFAESNVNDHLSAFETEHNFNLISFDVAKSQIKLTSVLGYDRSMRKFDSMLWDWKGRKILYQK